MDEHKKLVFVKEALKFYAQRPGASTIDKLIARDILLEIQEKIRAQEATCRKLDCITMVGHIPVKTIRAFDEKVTELRKMVGDDTAEAIVQEVNPSASAGGMPVAVIRLGVINQLAAAGVSGAVLLGIVEDFREHAALALLRAGHMGKFDFVYSPMTMTEFDAEINRKG